MYIIYSQMQLQLHLILRATFPHGPSMMDAKRTHFPPFIESNYILYAMHIMQLASCFDERPAASIEPKSPESRLDLSSQSPKPSWIHRARVQNR